MNPYAPPGAAVSDLPAKPGSAFKAIALGFLADIGGTFAATIVLILIYGPAAADPSDTDSWLFYAGTLAGLCFSVLGGYVCARIARRAEMKLGAVLAVLSAAIGILLADDHYQLGTLLSVTLASIGAVMMGARLGLARNRGTK